MTSDPTSSPETEPPPRLPLVATVGFAGHRIIDDPDQATELLNQAFAIVVKALKGLPSRPLDHGDEHLGDAYDGPMRLRLLSGVATGADRLAISRWRAVTGGEVHALFPFRDSKKDQALTDHPAHAGVDDRVEDLTVFDGWTGLDSVGLKLERDQAHAELGRWIVRHCDLLIVFWNGRPGQGLGGTGDTVRRALDRGQPVIWLEPGHDQPRLMSTHEYRKLSQLDEAIAAPLSIAAPLTADALSKRLFGLFAPPPGVHGGAGDPDVISRQDYVKVDPMMRRNFLARWVNTLLDRTIWQSFGFFKRTAGGLSHWKPPATAAPPDITKQTEPLEATVGFERIHLAFEEADRRANHLSSIHRSQQLLLIYLAVIAVFFGAASALPPIGPIHVGHIAAAWVELLLGVFALIISTFAQRAHRHRRWSDARRLAERLRAAQATWPLGVDLADASERPALTWTEWRARAVLRNAGPPTGWLGHAEFARRSAVAKALLIDGQIRYHARERHLAEHIEHNIHVIEGVSFGSMMIAVASFLVLSTISGKQSDWADAIVALFSSVSPAIGAACLALEATNGFSEVARRSTRMRQEFEKLESEISTSKDLSLHHVQEVLRSAAQLLVEDADSWRDRLVSRKIVRAQ
jgi:hypothetical protein